MKARRLLEFLAMGPFLVSLVLLGQVVVGIGIDELAHLSRFSSILLNVVLASILMLGGLAVVLVSGLFLFRIGRGVPYGDIVKSLETSSLVRAGPYRFSRNPMILGYFLILVSVGLFLGSVGATVIIPLVAVLLLSAWIKWVEEAGLERRFGDDYSRYKESVSFLLLYPRRKVNPEHSD